MANYIIIGGDNKEYGPVTEAEIRQWIAEGRLNAQSRVKAESDAEFRPLGLFPELADALPAASAPGTIGPVATARDFQGRDYELDLGGCISGGWTLLKEHFGIIFGSFIILLLVDMGTGMILGVLKAPFSLALIHAPAAVRVVSDFIFSGLLTLVSGPMMGGLSLVYLKTIRREPTDLGELFAGFQRAYLQLVLGALAVTLIVGAFMIPFNYVSQEKIFPLLAQMQQLKGDPSGLQNLMPQIESAGLSALPVLLVCLLPVTFFSVCWMFTLPLIIDKRMAFGVAMKTSWTMVMKHWWILFGLTLIAGLVSFLGIFACCIGIVFTLPIGTGAVMHAYETIFGAKKN